MFLVTPHFTVRLDSITKIVPQSEGTLVLVYNTYGDIDRETTTLSYEKVLLRLEQGLKRMSAPIV